MASLNVQSAGCSNSKHLRRIPRERPIKKFRNKQNMGSSKISLRKSNVWAAIWVHPPGGGGGGGRGTPL